MGKIFHHQNSYEMIQIKDYNILEGVRMKEYYYLLIEEYKVLTYLELFFKVGIKL